jgi:capsular exopolysaccharide synthesis family protein
MAESDNVGDMGVGGDGEQVPYSVIFNHKRLLFWVCFTSLFVALLILMQVTNLYSAETSIMLDSNLIKVVDLDTSAQRGFLDDAYRMRGEAQVIQSPEVSMRVIKRAGLDQLEEFRPRRLDDSPVYNILHLALPAEWAEAAMGSLLGGKEAEYGEDRKESELVKIFQKRLSVRPIQNSKVLKITFTSKDPDLAARISNMVAEEYISYQMDLKLAAATKANEWLKVRLVELKEKLEASENAISDYVKKNALFESGGRTLDSQQLSEVNSQLIIARSSLAQTEAKYVHLRNLFAKGDTKGMVSSEDVLASPVIQRLRMQEAELAAKISDLSQEYGDKHPVMMSARAQYEDTKREMRSEVDNIVKSLKNNVDVAAVKVASLQGELSKVVSSTGEETEAKIKLRALEREANANRGLYENFLLRFKKTNEEQNMNQSDTRIVSKGEIPIAPSYPNKPMALIFTFALSLIAGSVLAYILELRGVNEGFINAQQVKAKMGVRMLGAIPDLASLEIEGLSPEDSVLDMPFSPYAEAVRSVATTLYMLCAEEGMKSFLITSALPMEGKTAVSISLARSCAMDSHKVLHIDFDLRRPTARRRLRSKSAYGILDVLEKRRPLSDCVIEDKSGAHFITNGSRKINYPMALKTGDIKALIEQASKKYDIILLDSAPVLPVRDSRSLAQCVNAVVFLVKWKQTKRQDAQTAVDILKEHNARLAGVVLTSLDIKENMKYGYQGAGYYYGTSYKHYYSGS